MGYSPAQAGFLIIFISAASLGAKVIITPLVRSFGYRIVLVVNTITLGILICSFVLLGEHPNLHLLIALFLVMDTVNSMQFTDMSTLTLIDLTDNYTAGGNSLLSMVMQLSISLGVSTATALLHNFEGMFGLNGHELIQAFNYTFICIGVFAMLGAIPFSLIQPGCGKETAGKRANVIASTKNTFAAKKTETNSIQKLPEAPDHFYPHQAGHEIRHKTRHSSRQQLPRRRSR